MKQYRSLCDLAVALLLAASLFAAPAAAEDSGLVTKASRYGAKETIQRFEEAVKSKGWIVFSEIDHAGAAKQFGIEMKSRTVVLFGNPGIGTAPMQKAATLAIDNPPRLSSGRMMMGRFGSPIIPVSTSAAEFTRGTGCPCRQKQSRTSSSF